MTQLYCIQKSKVWEIRTIEKYMPIKYIRQEQHDVEEKWQKFGEGIYYKSKIALLVENLIQTLNGYKEIEIL